VEKGLTEIEACRAAPRVGINAHLLAHGEGYRRAGVSRYIYNLLAYLVREDPQGDYTVFLSKHCVLSLPHRQRRSRLPTRRPWARILWEQFLQPFELVRERISLLHSPVNVQPFFLPCKGVVTVTDLSFMAFPQSFRPFQRWYQWVFTRESVQRASRVIAISASTAQDLTRFFAVPPSKITVIFPGVDPIFYPTGDPLTLDEFRRQRRLPDKFVLFVGTLEPRKNLVTLLRAYAQFKRQGGADHKLVLAGGKGWLYEPIFGAVESLGLQADVLFPGYVPDDELPMWYNAADVFVYPSLYEGFGLPPLEAMACGRPVIVADTSSLPEVVGDAAIRVSPQAVDEWAAALIRLCQDEDLRVDLARRGIEQAKGFSWGRMARETAKLYRDVLSGCA